MRRSAALRRRIVVLAALSCAFLAVVLLRPSRAVEPTTVFPAAFPDFDPSAVASLRIQRATTRDGKTTENVVVLERAPDSGWQVGNRGGYPAKTSEVAALLDEIRDAKTVREDTTDPARAAAFAGTDGWTEITASGAGGKPLARLGLGKAAAGADSGTSYVRIGEQPGAGAKPGAGFRVVTAKGIDAHVQVDPESWVDRDVWPAVSASDLGGIEIDHREKGRVVSLARAEKKPAATPADPHAAPAVEPDAWTLEKPAAGPASASAANATVQAFSNLSLERLVDVKPEATDAEFGFDEPILVVTGRARQTVARPETYVLTVGKRVEGKDSHYARRGSEPFVFEVTRGSLGEFEHEASHWAEKPPEKPATDGEKKPAGDGGAKPADETPSDAKPSDEKPADGAGAAPSGDAPEEPEAPEPPPGGGQSPPAPPGSGETPPPAPPTGGGDPR